MKVFLSGPITGLPNENIKAFNKEAGRLRALGYDVITPHKLFDDQEKSNFQWTDYMKRTVPEMLKCDLVACLDDWYNSKGSVIEVNLARELGIPDKLACIIKEKAPV